MKFVVLPFYNYLGSIPPYYTVNFKNSSISRIKFFFLNILTTHMEYAILVPWPGIEHAPALEAPSLNHLTTRENPRILNVLMSEKLP